MAARNKFDIDEELDSPFSMKHLKRSFVYIKQHSRKLTVAFSVAIAASIISLFFPLITQRMLGETVAKKDYHELFILAVAALLTVLIPVILNRFRTKLTAEVGQDIIYEIRSDLFKHLQKLPNTYFDNRPHGKILVRVVSYVNNVSNMLSNGIIDFILQILNLIFIVAFMFVADARLALVILSGLPILAIVIFAIKPVQRRAFQRVSNKGSNYNAYVAESVNGMRITQIFAREKVNEGIFARLNQEVRSSRFRAAMVSNSLALSIDNISQVIFAFLYIAGVLWVHPSVDVGTLAAMAAYSWRFWQPIAQLSNIYNEFMNTISYLERIFELLDEPILIDNALDAYEMPDIVGEVEFDGVTFGYEEGTNVLHNMSFKITPGMSVALVGPTGAGKTTIVSLLSRFYDISSGKITIDGHDISKVTLNSLRRQMGIMLQDSFVFSGTIADNIRYGRLDATQEEIEQAARAVHVDEFVARTDKGYETEIKERGGFLSQGQKQLLAFARTIIAGPKILILDEATSSIDTKTELFVQESIAKLLTGRTSFIIAHRLSTIRSCDRIMYIDNGGITEYGTHEELMAKRGDYYRMYTSQLMEL